MPTPAINDQNAAARLAGLLDPAMDAIVTVDHSQTLVLYNRAAERIQPVDGIGFDVAAGRKPQSLGLAGLRERAQLLNGRIAVHSRAGEGTTVEAFIPVREEGGA